MRKQAPTSTPFLDKELSDYGKPRLELHLGFSLTVTSKEIRRLQKLFDEGKLTKGQVEIALKDLPDLGNVENQRMMLVRVLIENNGGRILSVLQGK